MKRLQIGFDLEGAPVTFRSRRKPIKSILLNLALNAIKFTATGSVTIGIRIAVSPKLGPAIELSVRDTGPGIEPGLVARAFKPCTQLSSSSVRKHRGMGLGLAVVQKNAIALGAKLAVKSELGQGSTFTVTVPVDRTPLMRQFALHP